MLVYNLQHSSTQPAAVQDTTCSSPVHNLQHSSIQPAAVRYTPCSSPVYVLYFQYLNYCTPNSALCEQTKHVEEFFKYVSCTGILLLLFKYKTQRVNNVKIKWAEHCVHTCVCVCVCVYTRKYTRDLFRIVVLVCSKASVFFFCFVTTDWSSYAIYVWSVSDINSVLQQLLVVRWKMRKVQMKISNKGENEVKKRDWRRKRK